MMGDVARAVLAVLCAYRGPVGDLDAVCQRLSAWGLAPGASQHDIWQLIYAGHADGFPNGLRATEEGRSALAASGGPLLPTPQRAHYTNWRGEAGVRHVLPVSVDLGRNEWHPERQFLMLALDTDRGEDRTFALKDLDFMRGE